MDIADLAYEPDEPRKPLFRSDGLVAKSERWTPGLSAASSLSERLLIDDARAAYRLAEPAIEAFRRSDYFATFDFGGMTGLGDAHRAPYSIANGINLDAMRPAAAANDMLSLAGSAVAANIVLPRDLFGFAMNDFSLLDRFSWQMGMERSLARARSITSPLDGLGASALAYLEQELRNTAPPVRAPQAFDPIVHPNVVRIKPKRLAETRPVEPLPNETRIVMKGLAREVTALRAEVRELRAERDAGVESLHLRMDRMEAGLTNEIRDVGRKGSVQARRYFIISMLVAFAGFSPFAAASKVDEWLRDLSPSPMPSPVERPPAIPLIRDVVLRSVRRRDDPSG